MEQGWFKLYRELLEKAIWQNSTPEQKVILITLLSMANHEGREWEWEGRQFKADPGQFVTSIDSIIKKAGKGISSKNVRTALEKFEKYGFLANESTKTGRLITIVNWRVYQGNDSEGGKDNGRQVADRWQRGGRQVAANKNDKNDKNVKNDKNIYLGDSEEEKEPEIKPQSKPARHKYGEFKHVLLSDEEYTKLTEEYGEEAIKVYIQRMDEYIEQKGKGYKNYSLALRNWIKKDKQQPQKGGSAGATKDKSKLKFDNFQGRNYDYDALEKKLLGWEDD